MIPFYYHENYPNYFNKLENFYIMWRLKASAKRADRVITISEASKNDIIKYSHTNEDRIVVIHNGYNAIEEGDYGEPKGEYILAVTSGLPHKNALGIVKSYEEYCKMTASPISLIIIGIEGVAGYEVASSVADKISCIKYVAKNEEMHRLIHGARVFLFLSFIEGFGFPPIEAMQLETPVICSDRSSLPEVVGDAAILVNPEDYHQVAESIVRVLAPSFDRGDIINKGKINAERFNWNKTGDKYREILLDKT
jgi:glycosyltransferase involved in cell wall biosynthesis